MRSGELPDRASDVEEATITAGQILQSLHGKLQPGGDWRMEVTDEFGHPLHAGAAMSRLTLATNALLGRGAEMAPNRPLGPPPSNASGLGSTWRGVPIVRTDYRGIARA